MAGTAIDRHGRATQGGWAGTGGVIREFGMNEHWSVQAPPSGTTSVALVVDVTRYGSPVQITAPAASDTYVGAV